MSNEEIQLWCESNGVSFTQFTQWHLRLLDAERGIQVDLWPSKNKYKYPNADEAAKYTDLLALLEETFEPAQGDAITLKIKNSGIYLLDYFAAKAMQSMILTTVDMASMTEQKIAKESYDYAAAMIDERKKYITQ